MKGEAQAIHLHDALFSKGQSLTPQVHSVGAKAYYEEAYNVVACQCNPIHPTVLLGILIWMF